MSQLLIILLFVLPIATIIFSVFLQKIVNCPTLVALVVFAAYLIVAFAVGDTSNLALYIDIAIIYAIIAFITAWIARCICKIHERVESDCNECCNRSIQDNSSLYQESNNQNYRQTYINSILGDTQRYLR